MPPSPPTQINSPLIQSTSDSFPDWLQRNQLCLAVSTYQHDQLILLSAAPQNDVKITSYPFDRPMGMSFTPMSFQLATRQHIWRFERSSNYILGGASQEDVQFRLADLITTGFLDAHDLLPGGQDSTYLVDTHHSCIRELHPQKTAKPVWKPEFITELVPEDRCHLNGVAGVDGALRYATVVSQSNQQEGWRRDRECGGLLIDTTNNEVVARNLTMPHSPRIHRGRIWVLNAGTGEFGFVTPGDGGFNPVAFCPGFLRGLAFHNEFAVLGLSQARHNKKFADLPLGKNLADRNVNAICGLMVIHTETYETVATLQFADPLTELFDVQLATGVGHPTLLKCQRTDS